MDITAKEELLLPEVLVEPPTATAATTTTTAGLGFLLRRLLPLLTGTLPSSPLSPLTTTTTSSNSSVTSNSSSSPSSPDQTNTTLNQEPSLPPPPPIKWTPFPSPLLEDEQEEPNHSNHSQHPHLLVFRHKATLKLTLNRPDKGNALTPALMQTMLTLFRHVINPDPTIHRVFITGRGKYFCTGMDLGSGSGDTNNNISKSSSSRGVAVLAATSCSLSSGPAAKTDEDKKDGQQGGSHDDDDNDPLFSPTLVPQQARLLRTFFHTIDTCPKQTIALLNGPAFGGGVGLLTVCDIRLASAASPFFCCLSEIRLGLVPATITRYVVREWGPSLARMAIISGRKISAEVMLRAGVLHGLLTPVVSGSGGDDDDNDDDDDDNHDPKFMQEQALERAFVQEWLRPDLRYAAPEAVGMCKRLVRSATARGDDSADTDDEGVKAFEDMLLGGTSAGDSNVSEAKIGVGLFRKGVKGVVWEDMSPGGDDIVLQE